MDLSYTSLRFRPISGNRQTGKRPSSQPWRKPTIQSTNWCGLSAEVLDQMKADLTSMRTTIQSILEKLVPVQDSNRKQPTTQTNSLTAISAETVARL